MVQQIGSIFVRYDSCADASRQVRTSCTKAPNSFTARGPVTLTAILFPQPAV